MTPAILDLAQRNLPLMSGFVLEVGAYDENGSIREVVPVTLGVDMRPGKGVDEVMRVEDLVHRFGKGFADVVLCCEALEHMEAWDAALVNLWDVLSEGGLLLLTMAAKSKGWHGYPGDYWRMEREDFRRLFGANQILDELPAGLVSIGAVVRKSGPLDFSVRPEQISRDYHPTN